jgi:hypothetical protein
LSAAAAARTRVEHLIEVAQVDAADREPGAGAAQRSGVPGQVQSGSRAAGLGRRRPGRPDAEVVDAGLDRRRVDLRRVVAGPADHHVVADDRARIGHR